VCVMNTFFLDSEMVVRCPYCTDGIVESRLMVGHVDGRFICRKCGHTTRPADPEYRCSFGKYRTCRKMNPFPAIRR